MAVPSREASARMRRGAPAGELSGPLDVRAKALPRAFDFTHSNGMGNHWPRYLDVQMNIGPNLAMLK